MSAAEASYASGVSTAGAASGVSTAGAASGVSTAGAASGVSTAGAASGDSTAGAALRASRAADPNQSTAGATSGASRAAGSSGGTAGASSSSRSAAAAGGGSNEPSRNVRSRRPSAQNSLRTLYTTPFGGKYHVDRNCHGLRNASQVAVTPRCPRCGPQSEIPRWELYAIGHGYELHVSYEHCKDYGSNRPLRRITPCAICCSDADMYT